MYSIISAEDPEAADTCRRILNGYYTKQTSPHPMMKIYNEMKMMCCQEYLRFFMHQDTPEFKQAEYVLKATNTYPNTHVKCLNGTYLLCTDFMGADGFEYHVAIPHPIIHKLCERIYE